MHKDSTNATCYRKQLQSNTALALGSDAQAEQGESRGAELRNECKGRSCSALIYSTTHCTHCSQLSKADSHSSTSGD